MYRPYKADMAEKWDAYDSNFNIIENMTLTRGEEIPEGVFHLVCEAIVRHVDGTYLLMQRDTRKHFGGMWEATAGGSALKGEEARDCAIRELSEETGIIADELTEVGRVVNECNRSIYVEFLCVTAQNKNNVTLQEGETADYRWVSSEELRIMPREELVTQRMQYFIEELRR